MAAAATNQVIDRLLLLGALKVRDAHALAYNNDVGASLHFLGEIDEQLRIMFQRERAGIKEVERISQPMAVCPIVVLVSRVVRSEQKSSPRYYTCLLVGWLALRSARGFLNPAGYQAVECHCMAVQPDRILREA